VKFYIFLNFAGVLLLHRYNVGNPLHISVRSIQSCVE
jgi:hypothetical protein